jgi:hypothetical protein
METLSTKYDSKTVQIVTSGELLVMGDKVSITYAALRHGETVPVTIDLTPQQMKLLHPHKVPAEADFYFAGLLPAPPPPSP